MEQFDLLLKVNNCSLIDVSDELTKCHNQP